jgi:hypothetical protein
VRNRGDEAISLKVYAGDFCIAPDGQESFFAAGKVERSCAKWIEVSPEEFELTAGQSLAIRFKLAMPSESTGSYWGMVFVEQTNKPSIKTARQGQQQFNILSFQRIGIRIFADTPQSRPSSGKVSQVNVSWDMQSESFKVGLKFENDGEVLLKCKGEIEIKDAKGETVKNVELEEFNCYPKSARISAGSITASLAPGKYTALAVIDYGAESLVAGESAFEVAPSFGNFALNVVKGKAVEPTNNLSLQGVSREEAKAAKVSLREKITQIFLAFGQMVKDIFVLIWKKITRG